MVLRSLLTNKIKMEEFHDKISLFSEVIMKVNTSIEEQLKHMYEHTKDKSSLDNLDPLVDLIVIGYTASYLKNTWQQMEEIPFLEDALLLNESMKEILISSAQAMNAEMGTDMYEELRSRFKKE